MGRSSAMIIFGMMWLIHLAAAEYDSINSSSHFLSSCSPGSCNEGRTFGLGHRRRMTMFLLPVMFKLGVIVTLLIGLTVLAFKGLTIGVILLVFAFGGIFTKLKGEKSHQPSGAPIHVHVHDFENSHKFHLPSYSYPSGHGGGWDRTEDVPYSWEDYLGRQVRPWPSYIRNGFPNRQRHE